MKNGSQHVMKNPTTMAKRFAVFASRRWMCLWELMVWKPPPWCGLEESSAAPPMALSLVLLRIEDDFFRLLDSFRFFFRLKTIHVGFGLKIREDTTIGGSLAIIGDVTDEEVFAEVVDGLDESGVCPLFIEGALLRQQLEDVEGNSCKR